MKRQRWKSWFAWYPVKTLCGQWRWLVKVQRHRNWIKYSTVCHISAYSFDEPGWDYR